MCALAVKGHSILDADQDSSVFQYPCKKGRSNFSLLFLIPAFMVGSIWGQVHEGAFKEVVNEHLGYSIALLLGIYAYTAVQKLNDMNIKELIDLLKSNFPNKK